MVAGRRSVRFHTDEEGEVLATCFEPPKRRRSRRLSPPRSASPNGDVVPWLQRDDFIKIRDDALRIVDSVKEGRADMIWEKARKHSYAECLREVYDACRTEQTDKRGNLDVSPTLREDLEFWMSVGHTRRGLERVIVDFEGREERRVKMLDGVLFVQEKCREENMPFDQTSRLLRTASEIQSKVSRKFAEIIGEADEAAVRIESELMAESSFHNGRRRSSSKSLSSSSSVSIARTVDSKRSFRSASSKSKRRLRVRTPPRSREEQLRICEVK